MLGFVNVSFAAQIGCLLWGAGVTCTKEELTVAEKVELGYRIAGRELR